MKKVLIVDDDIDMVTILKTILESKGHTVLCAYNSKEGVESFIKNKPDVVLLDLMMEDMDSGIKVCKEIRSIDKDVKIYMLSNVGDEAANTIEVNKLGFNGAISKPVKPQELISLIE